MTTKTIADYIAERIIERMEEESAEVNAIEDATSDEQRATLGRALHTVARTAFIAGYKAATSADWLTESE